MTACTSDTTQRHLVALHYITLSWTETHMMSKTKRQAGKPLRWFNAFVDEEQKKAGIMERRVKRISSSLSASKLKDCSC